MSPKTGRPKSENPKNINLNIRLNKEQADLIQKCADKLNTTRTDVILKGIQIIKVELDKKNNDTQPSKS